MTRTIAAYAFDWNVLYRLCNSRKQLKRQAASSNNNIDHAQNVENKVDSVWWRIRTMQCFTGFWRSGYVTSPLCLVVRSIRIDPLHTSATPSSLPLFHIFYSLLHFFSLLIFCGCAVSESRTFISSISSHPYYLDNQTSSIVRPNTQIAINQS